MPSRYPPFYLSANLLQNHNGDNLNRPWVPIVQVVPNVQAATQGACWHQYPRYLSTILRSGSPATKRFKFSTKIGKSGDHFSSVRPPIRGLMITFGKLRSSESCGRGWLANASSAAP